MGEQQTESLRERTEHRNYPVAVRKRDGRLEDYSPVAIESTIEAGVRAVGGTDFELAKRLAQEFSEGLGRRIVPTSEIDESLSKFLMDHRYDGTAWAVRIGARQKERARGHIAVLGSSSGKGSTNSFLMVGSASKETASGWTRERVVTSLINEGEVDLSTARSVAESAETYLFSSQVPQITTQLIREAVHTELIKRNLMDAANKYRSFGIPRADLEQIMHDRIRENSNVTDNNPEAINFGVAGSIQKAWALSGGVFSREVAEAHSSGAVHIHDLDMPTRVYCSAHSLEYIKKYGLKLPTSSSVSGPAKHEEVLTGHLNTFLATKQSFYAGALGVGDINVFYAPHLLKDLQGEGRKRIRALKQRLEDDKNRASRLRGAGDANSVLETVIREEDIRLTALEANPIGALSQDEMDQFLEQSAQRLIFNGSQNAFSRGGQTLFLDFNIHADVPKHLRETPIILDGKYQLRTQAGALVALEERKLEGKTRRGYGLMELVDPRDGTVVLTEETIMQGKKEHLVQKVTTKTGESLARYGDPEYRTMARGFTRALLKTFGKGDFRGAPFAFPKCDFHVNDELLGPEAHPEAAANLTLAYDQASKNGSVYFVMDRDAVTMSACCRLRTTIDDDYVIQHPESMRFCGFQNVTVNLPQAAYRAAKKGNKTIEGLLEEVDWAMDIAVKAHLQKQSKIKQFQQPGGPQFALARPSSDGLPYVQLENSTYIIGEVGVNEAVQFLTGKQLHELNPQETRDYALRIIAHMNVRAKQLSEEYKLKFSIEESPAESAAKRLAMLDVLRFPESKEFVKGDLKGGVVYYTNSNHLVADAPVDLVTRIRAQGMYHAAIDSGAITHAFVGEERPSPEAIRTLVENTFHKTQTAQLVISPEFTVCESCDKTHAGLKDDCPSCGSKEIYGMSRIVGYFSKIHEKNSPAWIDSKIKELGARHRGDYGVEASRGGSMDLPVLDGSAGEYDFVVHRVGKPDCDPCKRLSGEVEKLVSEFGGRGVKIKHEYHDVYTEQGMVDLLVAGINPARLPGLVIMNRGSEVYRHSVDWGTQGRKFTDHRQMATAIDGYLAAHPRTPASDAPAAP